MEKRVSYAFALSALVCVGQTSNQRLHPNSRQPSLNEVLSWLPADTETVIGANGPFPLPDLDDAVFDEESGTQGVARRMMGFPLGPIGFRNAGLRYFLKGRIVVLTLEGSRRSRTSAEPDELASLRGEACEIVIFRDPISADRDSYMKEAANSVTRFEEMSGVRFAVFEESRTDEVWTTFVGFPRNNVVLIATEADYLRTVLARMSGANGPRALPRALPEWKYVRTSARVWGARHYYKRTADTVAPFPLMRDNDVIGVTFWFEPARRMASVTYLSGNPNAYQILQNGLGVNVESELLQMRLRQLAPGVIEGSTTILLAEALGRFLLGLGALLGHAVYL